MSAATVLNDFDRAEVLNLCKQLIERPSVTPHDAGCQHLMAEYLAKLGFDNESLFFVDTDNLWSIRGAAGPVFCFAGHTDVVPTGDKQQWQFPPFDATEHNGQLYGRGAADMKGSLAAMLVATRKFVEHHPAHHGQIAYLITSDEEGPFINGTPRVVATLTERGQAIDYCLVGEPSSTHRVGDVIKNGRRGSLTGYLTVKGIQGHVAYPHLAANPVHLFANALQTLTNEQWDEGNECFPPTSFQISNFNAGTGAGNVIPGEAHVQFNFRFSTESTVEQLQQRVVAILQAAELNFDLRWTVNGLPFLTKPGNFLDAVIDAVQTVTGQAPDPQTSGGTSDGRFIAQMGAQVVELGPVNKTIHQRNEHVAIADLYQLTDMYYQVLCKVLTE